MLLHLMPQVRKVERACKRHMLVLREVEAQARPGCLPSVMLRCPAGHDVHDWRVVLVINGVIVREPLRAAPFDSVARQLVGRSVDGFSGLLVRHQAQASGARALGLRGSNQYDGHHCARGHELTPENSIARPGRHRICRRCRQEWFRAYQRERRARLGNSAEEKRRYRERKARRAAEHVEPSAA